MKITLKKILAYLLVACMIFSLVPTFSFPVFAENALSIPGDVNNDGEVDGKDSTRLLQYLAEWDVEIDSLAADCNGDGEVDGKDSTRLLQYLAEWDVTLDAPFPDVDPSRYPNDEPIQIDKLYQLTSDGFADTLLRDDATVRAIDGNFTSLSVSNIEDALLVFQQLSPLLGLEKDAKELSKDDISYSSTGKDNSTRHYYRLNPKVNGVPVYGSDMILVVNRKGIPDGFHSSYDKRINTTNTVPTITSDQAETVVKEAFRTYLSEAIDGASDITSTQKEELINHIVDSLTVESNLIVYAVDQTLPILTWCVNLYSTNSVGSGDDKSLVDASQLSDSNILLPIIDRTYFVSANNLNSGQVVKELNNDNNWESSTDTAMDSKGNSRTINIQVDGKRARMVDDNRNIQIYFTKYVYSGGFLGFGQYVTPEVPGEIVTKGLGGWYKKAVSANYNFAKIYDFYSELGRTSYDGNGADIIASIAFVPYEGTSTLEFLEASKEIQAMWVGGSLKQFVFYDNGNLEAGLDVIGHEFTHAVTDTIVGGPSTLKESGLLYEGETGALDESYSDIMGSLIEGKKDQNRWLCGEDTNTGAVRDMSNPESKGQADNYSDLTDPWWIDHLKLNTQEKQDKGGVHAFSGIYSLAFYKMVMDNDTSCTNTEHNHSSRTRFVSDKKWAEIFYNSIHHLQIDAKFVDARMAVINEARAAGFTRQQIKAIEEAFEDVGITGTDVYLAKDTFNWEWYEHQNYEFKCIYPKPENREHSISIDGKDIVMNGFNVEAYKDFLYMANSDSSTKIFSFELVRDRTDWHSIEGAGFLFNTTIKDNTIEGYCILTTRSGLKLVKIDSCNLDDFMNGKYNRVEQAGRVLTTVNIGDPYAKQSYFIKVSPSEISVACNGEWAIDSYTLPAESESYGFGPITSHESHYCEQLSYYTFSNIRMESLRPDSTTSSSE